MRTPYITTRTRAQFTADMCANVYRECVRMYTARITRVICQNSGKQFERVVDNV